MNESGQDGSPGTAGPVLHDDAEVPCIQKLYRVPSLAPRDADGDEVGLQAVVMKDGALVADAQSGVADPVTGAPVSAGTLFFAGSTAKGVLSSLVHALVAAGRLDYDLHLAEVWPEFAAHGKGNVTVRHVLMHQAGVPGLPPDLRETLTEPLAVIDELHFAVPALLLDRVAR